MICATVQAMWKLNRSRKGPWVLLMGKYDEQLVDDLKTVVPATHRQWMPTMGAWRIDEEWAPKVQEIVDRRIRELKRER